MKIALIQTYLNLKLIVTYSKQTASWYQWPDGVKNIVPALMFFYSDKICNFYFLHFMPLQRYSQLSGVVIKAFEQSLESSSNSAQASKLIFIAT